MINNQRPRVLVIDDNMDWTELLCSALQGQYIVFGALDGKQGLEIAAREFPDLILCDVMMPQVTGAEVLRSLYIHPQLKRTQVIMMTANKIDAATQTLFKEHPNVRGFLNKPCNLEDVLKTVAYVLKTPNVRASAGASASRPSPTPAPMTPMKSPQTAISSTNKSPASIPPAKQVPAASPITKPLPGIPPKPAAAPASSVPGKTGRRYKVLIVDDDPAFFQFLNLVVHHDDQIFHANNGAEAIARMEETAPDLIILDLMMPILSGIEVMRSMKQKSIFAKIPIIVITGAHMTPKHIELMTDEFPNVRHVMLKPCDVPSLRQTIDSILNRDMAG